MEWDQIANKVAPYIVKIETPTGSGTGFLCFYNEDKTLCGVATALHVISHADEWQEPVRINHIHSGSVEFLKEHDRFIYLNWETDSAIIIFPVGNFPFPGSPIPLLPVKDPITIGSEVGWFGFPGLSIAQDVSYFHDVIQHIKSLDEARKEEKEIKPPLEAE